MTRPRPPPRGPSDPPHTSLGILALRVSAEELLSLRGLVQAIGRIEPDLEVVVIGETLADRELMQWPNVFVTGAVNSSDFNRVLAQYQVQSLLTGLGQPLFGHPIEREAMKSGLPMARFDWSLGRYHPSRGTLAINPALASGQIAERLVQWIERR